MDPTDAELLTDYHRGSQSAFTQIVRRHVDLVYAVALRRTGDAAVAEDVTQAVFIVLARKARSLRDHGTVAGWLLVVTRNLARTAVRTRSRRQRHEHAAARSKADGAPMTNPAHTAADAELNRCLDDAMAALRASERDAVALRFLQSASFADVGDTLGISEDAARKRVARGLDRLRALLARRGVSVSAVVLTATLQASTAGAAPPHLSAAIAGVAAKSAAASAAAWPALTKGIASMTMLKKVAIAAIVVVASLGAGGAAVFWSSPATPPVRLVTPAPAAAAVSPATEAPWIGDAYINGNVAFPGTYSVNTRQPTTLTQALIKAKPARNRPIAVRLIRRQNGTESIRDFVINDLKLPQADDPNLLPDDLIQITGWVTPPGFEAALAKFDAAVVRPERLRIVGKYTGKAEISGQQTGIFRLEQDTITYLRDKDRYDVGSYSVLLDAKGLFQRNLSSSRIVATPQQTVQRDDTAGEFSPRVVGYADTAFETMPALYSLSICHATEGYFRGDAYRGKALRISDVLRNCIEKSLSEETAADGKRVLLLQGMGQMGERKLWLDADTGLPVRVEILRQSPDYYNDGSLLADIVLREVYDGFEYATVQGRPIGRRVHRVETNNFPSAAVQMIAADYVAEHIDLDPTFDESTDFIMDLPNGTPVTLFSDPGVGYLWRDGRIVFDPNVKGVDGR